MMRDDDLATPNPATASADQLVTPADLILAFEETQAMIRDEDGRVRHWSRGAERLYGYSREEAVGATSHALLKTIFPRPLGDIEAALRADGVWSGELAHRHKDGGQVLVGSHWVLSRKEGQRDLVIEVNNDISAKIAERERMIALQQKAIRELATPILQIRDRLLLLPIIGVIDTARAREMTGALLAAVREKRAKVVVFDISAVEAIDSKVAQHLLQIAAAARLMGATMLITGVSAAVAQTVVSLGVDFGAVKTLADLQLGLQEADRILAGEALGPAQANVRR
jgi:PAS domain S-box-containing protein